MAPKRVTVYTEIRSLDALVASAAYLADYGFSRHREDLWLEGVQGLLSAAKWASELLSFGQNPPRTPETPGEWKLILDAAVRAFMALARQIRRGRGRISVKTERAWASRLSMIETRLVLQARVMREEFLRRWTHLWIDAMERKYGRWSGRRLR